MAADRIVRVAGELALAAAGLLLLVPFVAHPEHSWHEWSNYFWLLQHQDRSLAALGRPTFFLHGEFGVFYPQFVLYGGTLWSAAAYLAQVLDSTWAAFVALLVAGYAMAYGGSWWLGRQLGLRGLGAHAPALVVVASPYLLVGNLYGRGDWAEIVALGAVPLCLASALALVRGHPRPRPGPAAGLIAGTAVVTGSHALTTIWGALLALALLGVLAFAERVARPARWALAAGAAALGAALNAWFLLPGSSVAADTRAYEHNQGVSLGHLSAPDVVFSPWPRSPDPTTVLYPQLPVFVLVWVIVAGVVGWRGGAGSAARRAFAGLTVVFCLLVALLLSQDVWAHFPHALRTIQFTVRMQAYAVFVLAGLVVAGLVLVRGTPRARTLGLALGGALAIQAALAAWVAISTEQERKVERGLVTARSLNPSFAGDQRTGFRLREGGRLLHKPARPLLVSPADALDEDVDFTTPPGGAGLHPTNVVWSPFVRATGDARIAGRDPEGLAVVEVKKGGLRATIEPDTGGAVRTGRIVSLLALAGSVVLLTALALLPRRRRR